MILQFLPSFNAGELDPRMDARVGLDKYLAGCRTLQNFIPIPYGGVSKRPGTLTLAETLDGAKQTRIEPFRFSIDTQYLLEFGHLTMRFMGNRRLVTNIGEFSHVSPWLAATPYASGGLILDGSTYWRANQAHTANLSNKFDAVPWKTVRSLTRAWTVGASFAVGDVCSFAVSASDVGLFEARLANVAAVGNAPSAGTNATWFRIDRATTYWTTATASYPLRNGLQTSYARALPGGGTGGLPVSCSYTRAGTTVTVTKVAHGRSSGDAVDIEFLTGGAVAGFYVIAVVDADNFTLTTAAGGTIAASSANYTLLPAQVTTAATYSRTLTTLTVTKAAHGRGVNDTIYAHFTSGGALDSFYNVASVVDANTFTVTTAASGTIAGGSTMTYIPCLDLSMGAATYGRTATTVTITKVNHGHVAGEIINAAFVPGGAASGLYTIASVPTVNTFTVTTIASGTVAPGAALIYSLREASGTYFRNGTVVTATFQDHGLQAGDAISARHILGGATDGPYNVISVISNHRFTYVTAAAGTIAPGSAFVFQRRELYQCEITNTPDTTNRPGLAPPWAVDVPGPETTFVVATPWTEDEIFDLQFRQINDIVIICHPNHEPQILTRTHSDFFTLLPVAWDWPALRDENVDGTIKLTPSGTTGTITLSASKDVFQPLHVGAHWALAWAGTNRSSELKIQATTQTEVTSPWITVAGRWNSYSFNYWDGVFEIHRSFDGGSTFEVIRSYKASNGDRNFNTSGEEAKECSLRLKFKGVRFAYTGGANYDAHAVIEVIDHREWGLLKVTDYINPTQVTATVVRTMPYTDATHIWAEGAFSSYRGYPRTTCLHAGRVWYGGNTSEPMRLWGSVTDDFYNFRRSSLADGSIAATIASVAMYSIQWLASGTNSLLVGTQGVEYIVQGSGDDPIGPGNVTARPQSSYGSAYLPAILVNYVTLFVQRSRLSVREFVYSLERNGFVAADMTKLASHIVNPGLKQWAYQQSFNAIVWAITSDGKLVGLTYEREENVVGWHRHATDGTFESVAVLYGAEGTGDEVYVVTRRTINGVQRRFIELMQPDAYECQRDGRQSDCVMSDAAVVLRGTFPSGYVVTGLGHLEGKTVQILADGAKRPDAVVSAGKITMGDACSTIIVGLPFEAVIMPMKVEVQMRDGSAQTRAFKINRLAMRVWQSLGGEVHSDADSPWQTISWRDTADPMGTVPPLFTGEKEMAMDSRTGDSLDFAIRSHDPHPLTIIALAPKFEVSGQSVVNSR